MENDTDSNLNILYVSASLEIVGHELKLKYT